MRPPHASSAPYQMDASTVAYNKLSGSAIPSDIYEWSGSGRRKSIREDTDAMIDEVREKLQAVLETGGEAEVIAGAERAIEELQEARAAFGG